MPRARLRIGTTSFVHPAGWAENVRRLAGRVQDVELLVFERPGPAGPSPAEIGEIAALGRAGGLTFSVHAPLDLALASADEVQREASVEAVLRTVELAAPLAPHAVIVHVEEAPGAAAPDTAARAAWRERAEVSLRTLLAQGVPPRLLAVETLDARFEHVTPLVEELGLSVALDVGHLARDGVAFDTLLERHLARTRVIQWHGTEPGGRDHRSLRHYPRPDALRLLRRLDAAGWEGAITLEVFRADDLDDSLEVLAELRRAAPGSGAE
ncbi:MAG TPA: cobamide remodeling phosphodiesterase CbiR [Anaeromyxobacter sp.]|nr:cobamide remodeling phosphodiesterase CbiR [Anaeromyxobacter sp.]